MGGRGWPEERFQTGEGEVVTASRSRGARAAAILSTLLRAFVHGAIRAGGPRGLANFVIWAVQRSGIQISLSAATLAAIYPIIAPLLSQDDGDQQS